MNARDTDIDDDDDDDDISTEEMLADLDSKNVTVTGDFDELQKLHAKFFCGCGNSWEAWVYNRIGARSANSPGCKQCTYERMGLALRVTIDSRTELDDGAKQIILRELNPTLNGGFSADNLFKLGSKGGDKMYFWDCDECKGTFSATLRARWERTVKDEAGESVKVFAQENPFYYQHDCARKQRYFRNREDVLQLRTVPIRTNWPAKMGTTLIPRPKRGVDVGIDFHFYAVIQKEGEEEIAMYVRVCGHPKKSPDIKGILFNQNAQVIPMHNTVLKGGAYKEGSTVYAVGHSWDAVNRYIERRKSDAASN